MNWHWCLKWLCGWDLNLFTYDVSCCICCWAKKCIEKFKCCKLIIIEWECTQHTEYTISWWMKNKISVTLYSRFSMWLCCLYGHFIQSCLLFFISSNSKIYVLFTNLAENIITYPSIRGLQWFFCRIYKLREKINFWTSMDGGVANGNKWVDFQPSLIEKFIKIYVKKKLLIYYIPPASPKKRTNISPS